MSTNESARYIVLHVHKNFEHLKSFRTALCYGITC